MSGFRWAALAACAFLSSAVSFAADDPRAPLPVHAPDTSQYDCTAAGKRSLHIGQVILGRYYEWNEIYGGDDGNALTCIALIVPRASQLDAAQAKNFLLQSAAIGVPVPGAQSAPTQVESQSDVNVIPEPPKRVRRGAPAAPPDASLPPIPAERRSSDPPQTPPQTSVTPETAAPALEKPNAVERDAAADPRTLVDSTTIQSYPWNTIGYFTVTYPNGKSYRCTGTVVSAYVVLTAGHCIHNNARGGWVTDVRFSPGQYVNSAGAIQRPYGSNSGWSSFKATQTWTQISGPDEFDVDQYRYDYAAIEFSTPFTYTTTFMPVIYGSTVTGANNAGYPGNLKNSTADQYGLYYMSGDETQDSLNELRAVHVREFAIYSSGGDSGGPFWVLDSSGRRSLVGSLSYGDDTINQAGGPWYDSWNQSLLSSWVSWTPTSAQAAVGGSLRIGAIYSTAQTASQSFLRFYNAGSSPATVTVKLADYATGLQVAQWTSPPIPAGASPQYGIGTIEAGATTAFTKPQLYSATIQTSMTGYAQHVLWRTADGSITNLSTCDSGPASVPSTVINVHSSLLQSGYPSSVVIFNTGSSGASETLGLYDATTGNRIATYVTPTVPANGQAVVSIPTIESSAGITPGGRFHYIVKAEGLTGFLQHLVNNQQSGVTSDMTAVCALAN